MLCHYDGTIAPDMNNSITYNSESSLLLNVICHGLRCN